jgi:hypothetical protein
MVNLLYCHPHFIAKIGLAQKLAIYRGSTVYLKNQISTHFGSKDISQGSSFFKK